MFVFCLTMMANTFNASTIPEVHKTAELKGAVLKVLDKRMKQYDASIEEDESKLLKELSARERMAVEVRLGEKRILRNAMERVDGWVVGPPSKRIKLR
jgi:N-lysine methyltransferase SETD6